MAEEDTMKISIIGTLLVIAVIYCLVEVVRYWHRRRNTQHTYKKYHYRHQHLSEQEYDEKAAAIGDILKHEENLFKQPPPNEDCPICFLTLPSLYTGGKYQTCCGKIICSGCIHAVDKMDPDKKCPFCRVPTPRSGEKVIEMTRKRMKMDDANAIHSFGCYYYDGRRGFRQDRGKALELFHRAGTLGCASAYYNIGRAYLNGEGVERDMKQAKHYWELAAIGGHAIARHNLGWIEERAGNMGRALKHHMIAVERGHDQSLKTIKEFYMNGHATKDDYAKALREYQRYVDGVKSDQRDEAAAFNSGKYRYH